MYFNKWKYVTVSGLGVWCIPTVFVNFVTSVDTNQTSRDLKLKVVWLPSNSQKAKLFFGGYFYWFSFHQNPVEGTPYRMSLCVNTSFLPKNMVCHNLSVYDPKQPRYVAYLRHKPSQYQLKTRVTSGVTPQCYFQCFPTNQILLTWKDASNMCKELKGSLPYFTSRGKFEAFLVWMTLHKHMPPVEAMFIGLAILHQVCFTFII